MDFPPPELSMPPPMPSFQSSGFGPRPFHPNYHHKPFYYKSYNKHLQVQDDFDGKRLRKSVMRKTVDYNAAIVKSLEVNIFIYNFQIYFIFSSF